MTDTQPTPGALAFAEKLNRPDMADVRKRWFDLLEMFLASADPARDQRVAEATVNALAGAGLLRQSPTTTAVVTRLIFDRVTGRVAGSVERVEHVGPDGMPLDKTAA